MTDIQIWISIVGLGLLTIILRSSFIVFWGDRQMPDWLMRHLRYVAVALIPGMIAQMIAYPRSLNNQWDLVWVIAAGVALIAGIVFKNALASMLFGGSCFIILMGMRSYEILF